MTARKTIADDLSVFERVVRAFMDAELTFPLPHLAALILALAAGAAQVVNQQILTVPENWHAYIGVGLLVVGYVGVKPLVGDQFRASLHLPVRVAQAITGLVGAATVVAGVLPVGAPGLPWLTAAVTVLVGLGFGPAASAIAASSARRRTATRAAATRLVRDRQRAAKPVA